MSWNACILQGLRDAALVFCKGGGGVCTMHCLHFAVGVHLRAAGHAFVQGRVHLHDALLALLKGKMHFA